MIRIAYIRLTISFGSRFAYFANSVVHT